MQCFLQIWRLISWPLSSNLVSQRRAKELVGTPPFPFFKFPFLFIFSWNLIIHFVENQPNVLFLRLNPIFLIRLGLTLSFSRLEKVRLIMGKWQNREFRCRRVDLAIWWMTHFLLKVDKNVGSAFAPLNWNWMNCCFDLSEIHRWIELALLKLGLEWISVWSV